jgi:hypothetical protein
MTARSLSESVWWNALFFETAVSVNSLLYVSMHEFFFIKVTYCEITCEVTIVRYTVLIAIKDLLMTG